MNKNALLRLITYTLFDWPPKRRKLFEFPSAASAHTYLLCYITFLAFPHRTGRINCSKMMMAYIVLSHARNIRRVLNAAQISKTGSELSVIFPKARESLAGLRRLCVCLRQLCLRHPCTPSFIYMLYIIWVCAYTIYDDDNVRACVCETSIIGVNIYNEINRARGRENFWALWQEERNLWHN